MESKHTPTPWTVDERGLIMGPNGNTAIHSVIDDVLISSADAAFIVLAVNAYARLIEFVEKVEAEGNVPMVRAAKDVLAELAKAEGK